MGYPVVGAGLPANTGSAGAIHRVASFAGMPTKDRRRLDYQRPAASWSLCFPSTHPVVCQSALPVKMTRIITDLQRATRALWERPCVAIGPQSGPGISALMRRLSGAATRPFRDTRPLPLQSRQLSEIEQDRALTGAAQASRSRDTCRSRHARSHKGLVLRPGTAATTAPALRSTAPMPPRHRWTDAPHRRSAATTRQYPAHCG